MKTLPSQVKWPFVFSPPCLEYLHWITCFSLSMFADSSYGLTLYTMKQKWLHFDEIFVNGCTESCQMTTFSAASYENFSKIKTFVSMTCCIILSGNAFSIISQHIYLLLFFGLKCCSLTEIIYTTASPYCVYLTVVVSNRADTWGPSQ